MFSALALLFDMFERSLCNIILLNVAIFKIV